MSEKRLSRWFPHNVKPARSGVYETQFGADQPGFSYWDGRSWGSTAAEKEGAVRLVRISFGPNAFTQAKRWRGLAHQPK